MPLVKLYLPTGLPFIILNCSFCHSERSKESLLSPELYPEQCRRLSTHPPNKQRASGIEYRALATLRLIKICEACVCEDLSPAKAEVGIRGSTQISKR